MRVLVISTRYSELALEDVRSAPLLAPHLHSGVVARVDAADPAGCDCGDTEAWKPEGFCSRHKGNTAESSGGDALDEIVSAVCSHLTSDVVT